MTFDSPAMTSSRLIARPRYEGANIRTWIGFKHFIYLVEEGMHQWFRDQGWGARRLYHECGLGVQLVSSSVHLPAVMEIDDEALISVEPSSPGQFQVRITVNRDDAAVTVLKGRVSAVLAHTSGQFRLPDGLDLPLRADLSTGNDDSEGRSLPLIGAGPEDTIAAAYPGGHIYPRRLPYFYCHLSDRAQHSSYVRLLEETVEDFLAARGISVFAMLQSRGWIPVVSRVRVQLHDDAVMEQRIWSVLSLTDIYKNISFDATVNFYVERGAQLVRVASARILHGYAIGRGPQAGTLAVLDDVVIEALTKDGQ
jgi:acyl-CoA thioesterase FadM